MKKYNNNNLLSHLNLEKTKLKNFIMSSSYISGLTQADGSFFCSLKISPRSLFGIQFLPKFTITADLDSKYVLESIQSYLNCGSITVNNKNHTAEFEVVRIGELQQVIIPHFINYPVFGAKYHAFKLFTKIVSAMYNKEKRSLVERQELLKLALSMNLTTNRKIETVERLFSLLSIDQKASEFLKQREKDIIESVHSLSNKKIEAPNDFISGFIDGDGSFFITFPKDGVIKTGFTITNDRLSKPLLEFIQQKLNNIGRISEGSKKELVFTVNGINQIVESLIPFIDQNPVYSEKLQHYMKFRTVSFILKNESPLSLESKLNIVELCYEMNKKGKHRNFSKSDYLSLLKDEERLS